MQQTTTPKKELSLFDSTCLIVGIIIGVGIYQMAPLIAKGAINWWGVMLIWAAGGLISLCGALGYAELATAYPREGGDYVYLSRAYGRWAGFLFGWIQLLIVRPGDIAVFAFAFATYARMLYDPLAHTRYRPLASAWFAAEVPAAGGAGQPHSQWLYAGLAVAVLTLVHVVGVRQGKWTQNVLTALKAVGLLAIVGVAVAAPRAASGAAAVESAPLSLAGISLSLIFVMFAFGGWNEMAYVAAEVKDSRRNIVRSLVLGTVAVTVLYLLVNGAFLYTLGYAGMANSPAVATDAVSTLFPEIGGRLISALVCISALGALSGQIFTGARISYAMGAEHRIFGLLGRWNAGTGTPVCALLLQGGIAVGLIAVLGGFVDAILYTAAPVYLFYLATSIAVIVLRRKEPHVPRPYRVTGYPATTIVFCTVCVFLAYSAVIYKPQIAGAAFVLLLLGLPAYAVSRRLGMRPPAEPSMPDA